MTPSEFECLIDPMGNRRKAKRTTRTIFPLIAIVVYLVLILYLGVYTHKRFERLSNKPMQLLNIPLPTPAKRPPWRNDQADDTRQQVSIDEQHRRFEHPTNDTWRQISIDELHRRFEHKTSNSCVSETEKLMCPPMVESVTSSDVVVKGCQVHSSFPTLDGVVTNQRADLTVPLYGQREYIFPWEAELLRRPPLNDLKELPDHKLSRFVQVSRGQTSECDGGGTLEYRLDLVDGYGKRRTLGMDDVRSWLAHEDDGSTLMTTAHVTDLTNGSYQISVPCLWTGRSQLQVNVAYPREYLRAVTNQMRLHIARPISALFRAGGSVSYTLCAATPNLPYSCLCNFTSWNKQSFYCGHPALPGLTCESAVAVRPNWFRDPINVTNSERRMMAAMVRKANASVINQSRISIVMKKDSLATLNACNQCPYDLTWTSRSPQGYWSMQGGKKRWVSLLCDNSKPLANINKCLNNVNIWIFGDSNSYRMYDTFSALVRCGSQGQWGWPLSAHCRNSSMNTYIHFYPHEYPMYLHGKDNPINKYGAVADILDNIPSIGRHLVVAHYYAHVQTFHMSTMRARLYALRDAVGRLVRRNSDVHVAIRGPHVIYEDWDANHAAGGDAFISQLLPLMKDIFKPTRNRVLFLDGYDMSVPIENDCIHPFWEFHDEMIRLFLNYVCGRKKTMIDSEN